MTMMTLSDQATGLRGEIERSSRSCGIALVGFAPLDGIAVRGELLERSAGLDHAVTLAYEIPPEAAYQREPTDKFYDCIVKGRKITDDAAEAVAAVLRNKGFRAVPVTTAYKTDRLTVLGQVSHKAVAHQAGLGWIGRSTLLITPQYGPRVRLTTVLTDAILDEGPMPMENRCGKCHSCIQHCPMGALEYREFSDHPQDRSDSIRYAVCDRNELATIARSDPVFCAMCITACPVGRTNAGHI